MVFTPMFPKLAHYWDHYCVFIFKEHLVVFPQVRFVKLELLVKKYEHFYSILPNCLCKQLGQFLCLLTGSEYSQCVLVNIDHCIFNFILSVNNWTPIFKCSMNYSENILFLYFNFLFAIL